MALIMHKVEITKLYFTREVDVCNGGIYENPNHECTNSLSFIPSDKWRRLKKTNEQNMPVSFEETSAVIEVYKNISKRVKLR